MIERREYWETLKPADQLSKSTLAPYNLWGMLTPVGANRNGNNHTSIRCLSCGEEFDSRNVAVTHECPYEQEFRETTKRFKRDPQRGGRRPSIKRAEFEGYTPPAADSLAFNIDPEEWVRWNAALLTERDQLRADLAEAQASAQDAIRKMKRAQDDAAYLLEQNHKMRATMISKEQAKAYQDYSKR